ncbi:hypothetical protein EGW08_023694, partial [Elysia chlorotica]
LKDDPLVQADSKCRAIVEEIIEHKTRLDRHQSEWRLGACYRATDQLVNVLLTCSSSELYYKLHWDEDWQLMDTPSVNFSGATNLAFFDGNIYIRYQNKTLNAFFPRHNACYKIYGGSPHKVVSAAMFPVGNELYSVYRGDGNAYEVESLNLNAHRQGKWSQVGKLFTRDMEVANVTNIGSRLVVFWKKTGQSYLSVECFDLTRRESFLLPDQLCSSSGLVTFTHGEQAFALQQNGVLWRISAQKEAPYISLKLELWLWNFHRAVSGAILVNQELWVFDTTEEIDGQSDVRAGAEALSLEGVFRRVRFCFVSTQQTNFVHAVVPKSFISS